MPEEKWEKWEKSRVLIPQNHSPFTNKVNDKYFYYLVMSCEDHK